MPIPYAARRSSQTIDAAGLAHATSLAQVHNNFVLMGVPVLAPLSHTYAQRLRPQPQWQ